MKLETVKAAIPSKQVTNEDILKLIEKHSHGTFEGHLDAVLNKIHFYLRYSGLKYRNWLDEGETPIELVCRAVQEALTEVDCNKKDIDLLVYTGIGRGFLEPGGAYHVASALGMERVQCFDIIDACMSWSRALRLVHSLFQTGEYKRALIVNAECNLHYGGAVYPTVFQLPNFDAIEWSFPAFTLGEAATATIVSATTEQEWEFYFSSRADLSDLCNVPLTGYKGYCRPTYRTGRNGVGNFTSFGFDLHTKGIPELLNIFGQLKTPIEKIRAIFTHASSKREWDKAGESLGVRHLLWHIYPTCGNVVSASVPTGIATAIKADHIKRGDRIVGWVGSAGMSFAAYSGIY